MKERTLWTNYNLDYEDWRSNLEECYPELDEDERVELMYDMNNNYLEDLLYQSNVIMAGEIICIAQLGLWYGRRTGYKLIGRNLSDCFYTDCDFATFWIDRYANLRCEGIHHDGRNHYLFRMLKPGLSDTAIDNFLDKLYYGTVTPQDISRYTSSLGHMFDDL